MVQKKGGELAFTESSYSEAKSPKSLYEAYYLDLTLQGKMEGFDWKAEHLLAVFENKCTKLKGYIFS